MSCHVIHICHICVPSTFQHVLPLSILVKYHTTHPALISLALSALAHYIDWIDITLIANDTLIPLFYQFLQDARYQNEAAECLIEVVDKRMQDRTKKLALIKQLR